MSPLNLNSNIIDQSIDLSQSSTTRSKKGAKNYKAKFLNENFGDKFTVRAGKEFKKVWTFRNEGQDEWPAGTMIS